MDFYVWAAAGLSIFIASFFATVSGFGFALVAMPLLTLVLPIKTVIVFNVVLALLLRILTMYRCRKDFEWETVFLVTLGCFVGSYPGSLALKFLSVTAMKLFLGTALLLAVLFMSRNYTVKIANKTLGRLGAGVLSGFFGTSTSISGPPLVLYFLNEHKDKSVMRADMIWIFGLSGAVTVAFNYWVGNIGLVQEWDLLMVVIPAMFVGIFAGERFFHRLNQQLFRKLSLLVVLIGGLSLLFSGIKGLGI